ncbi:MAG: Zn-dependent hydrolase, partial [Firmicutes bacterium]|nr:Zn-dependent hydrolase [Bacillota bacterium]
ASDADKEGRDLICKWIREAGMRVAVDRIGNIFGIWAPDESGETRCPGSCGTCGAPAPVMTGSHIDSVINAGQYDGCFGVVAAIELVETLREAGVRPKRPIVVSAFTNEEGVRYQPDMMGSLVYAGGLKTEEALASVGTDGTVLGDELARIGYDGPEEPGFLKPYKFIELHIEQGPIMDAEGVAIGAVEDLQGISWHRVTIEGRQNHAGTTPTRMRIDAGLAAAKVNVFLRERCLASGGKTVATVGTMAFSPNAVNVIPDRAVFTVDLRNPNEEALQAEEKAFLDYLKELEKTDGVKTSAERISRFKPVLFDGEIVDLVEKAAAARGLSCRRMTSGAGQDAQNMALICPTAMIFVPSVNGISHNPDEFSREEDLIAGANVLLDVISSLAGA